MHIHIYIRFKKRKKGYNKNGDGLLFWDCIYKIRTKIA